MLKCNPKFILLFFAAIITSCAPPQSFYKMEGTLNLRNKINKIVEESEIDLNMSIQVISLKYELSQRKKVYKDWQRQRPVEYNDVLILKKEWEVKQ